MVKFNPFDKTKADGTGRPKSESIPGRRLICTLAKGEVDGMIYAKKSGGYGGWVEAIMSKYNLERAVFEVDEKTGGLYYRD